MRGILIDAFLSHAQGHVDKHVANVEVLLQHPVGIGEHPQHLNEVDKLLQVIVDAEEKIKVIERWVK